MKWRNLTGTGPDPATQRCTCCGRMVLTTPGGLFSDHTQSARTPSLCSGSGSQAIGEHAGNAAARVTELAYIRRRGQISRQCGKAAAAAGVDCSISMGQVTMSATQLLALLQRLDGVKS